MSTQSYEVNTRTDSFRGTAAAVARMAVAWKRQGRDCSAYAVGADDAGRVTTREVPVTTIKATTAALRG